MINSTNKVEKKTLNIIKIIYENLILHIKSMVKGGFFLGRRKGYWVSLFYST